jgi:hypothetical protein
MGNPEKEKRNSYEDLEVDGRTILKWALNK